jgi:hypothetical protein
MPNYKRMRENEQPRDFRNHIAKTEKRSRKHRQSSGSTYILAMFLLFPFWLISGFNKEKAVDAWHKYSYFFPCPYKNKEGSCSNTFKEEGLKALVCKCISSRDHLI